MRYALVIIAVVLLIFIISKSFDNSGKQKILPQQKNENFMDSLEYQDIREKLLKSKPDKIDTNYKKCSEYCGTIKQKLNCEMLCDQYAEDLSDNYKYNTHIFGSAIDKFNEKFVK